MVPEMQNLTQRRSIGEIDAINRRAYVEQTRRNSRMTTKCTGGLRENTKGVKCSTDMKWCSSNVPMKQHKHLNECNSAVVFQYEIGMRYVVPPCYTECLRKWFTT